MLKSNRKIHCQVESVVRLMSFAELIRSIYCLYEKFDDIH